MRRRNALIALMNSAAAIVWIVPAHAQTSETSSHAQVEDIVVTAQRREERLIDVPVSVSALGGEALERGGITTVSNIETFVPNIQINQTVGNSFGPLISIRGLAPSADTSLGRDQPVGLYIDGVPIAKSTGAAFDTVDLERVEVLRGPQGTLYGKNTIGGAVNLVTRRPSGEFGGQVILGAGSHDLYTQRISIDLPTMGNPDDALGTLKAKFSYSGRQFDGFYKNDGPSRDFGRQRLNAGRVDVVWEPTPELSVSYAYDISDSKGSGAMLAISASGSIAPGTALYPLISPYIHPTRPKRISADNNGRSDFRVSGHAITTEYDAGSGMLGNLTLKSITAWRKMQTRSSSDFDGTPSDLVRFRLNNNYRQFSQELQMIGSGDRVQYTVGAFYMRDIYDVFNPRWNFQFGGNRFDLSQRGANNHSIAGYGQFTWTPPVLEDKLDMTIGLRWTKDTRDVWERFVSYNNYAANPAAPGSGVFQRDPVTGAPITVSGGPALGALPGGPLGPDDLIPLANKQSWSQLSPEFNLKYKLSSAWNIYGRVATGFKSGGFNDTASNNAAFNTPYDPEKLLSFELGTKGSFFERRLNLSAAVYHSIYKDFQAGVFVPAVITTNIINAGKAEFTGFELEGQLRPIDSLSFTFGYGYLDARYKDFVLPSGVDVTDSYKVPLAPKHNYLLGGEHRLDLGGVELISSLNYSWRSAQWGTITPDVLSKRKAYGVLDGRITLAGISLGGDTAVDFSVWGKNLTDEKYWVSGINLVTHTVRQWADPRSYGVEAKLKF
ncbi:TonB-dependent receptor [Sphingomonas sp. C3-2]|uniref:TonB-dependent receptor n=1 Tax=Sphingomonas sp. C3-2 TaxID=3062169 RepID=UPI00294AAE5A|nr:TonB-dependent receptor [Sphingomonas sp. C3-2]WOK35438.1 TonB-dependent receptor [Sphingomonas sp. C3-2]